VKQCFALHQLVANLVDQKVLIDGVEIEEKNQCYKALDGVGGMNFARRNLGGFVCWEEEKKSAHTSAPM